MQILGSAIPGRLGLSCIIIGVVLLVAGWSLLFPAPADVGPRVSLAAVLVLWSVPFVVVPPVLSADAFAYADLGWMMHLGVNPYVTHFGDVGGPYAALVDPIWVGRAFGYYPPLSLLANWLGVEVMGLHPYWGAIGQRLVAFGGLLLMLGLIPKLADKAGVSRDQALWIGVVNPIVVLHGVGGAHIDTLAIGLVMLGLWLSWRLPASGLASLMIGPMVIGLAVTIKPYALAAVVASAGWPVVGRIPALVRWRAVLLLTWRSVVAVGTALSSFVVFSLGSGIGFGWLGYLSSHYAAPTPTIVTLAPSLLVGQLIEITSLTLGRTGEDAYSVSLGVVSVFLLMACGWLLWRCPDQPVLLASVGTMVAVSWGQALHPWYLMLGLALLGLVPISVLVVRRLTWVVCGYLLAATFILPSPWISLALGTACAAILWLAHRTAFSDLGWSVLTVAPGRRTGDMKPGSSAANEEQEERE